MSSWRIILFLGMSYALAENAGAQTTNFTPRPPPRSYEMRAQMHSVMPGAVFEEDEEESHIFMPSTGGKFSAAAVDVSSPSPQQPQAPRSRDKQKKDKDEKESKVPDVKTILAGEDLEKDDTRGWNGLAKDVVKQRDASARKASAAARRDSEGGEATDAGDDERSADGQGGGFSIGGNRERSLWKDTSEGGSRAAERGAAGQGTRASVRADVAAQMPGGSSGNPQAGGRDAAEMRAMANMSAAEWAARNAAAGLDASDGLGRPRAGRDEPALTRAAGAGENPLLASPWKTDSAFGQQSSSFGAGVGLYQPVQSARAGDSIFSSGNFGASPRDDSLTRPLTPAPAPVSAGASAFGDMKKPSALPW